MRKIRAYAFPIALLTGVISLSANATGCIGLVYAMMDCSAYTCATEISGHRMKYEVLGKSEGNCKYSESDESGFALCSVSQEDFGVVSNYLVQLFTKRGNVSHFEIAKLKAKTCSFYRALGNSFIKREIELEKSDVRQIERKVEMRIRKEEIEGVKSLFFDEEDLKELG
ncbi:MAG: hypothetical protein AB8U44_03470 [Aaplasma endosymbiont of Hyalomma asiaticum]